MHNKVLFRNVYYNQLKAAYRFILPKSGAQIIKNYKQVEKNPDNIANTILTIYKEKIIVGSNV